MRDIFTIKKTMQALATITEAEEGRFSDIPGWTGDVMSWTPDALLLAFPGRVPELHWWPMSQLRKAPDEQSVYGAVWLIEKLGLV